MQIIVLAAGFSSRLGRSKALTRVHGTSLLRRTLLLSRCRFAKILVVVPPRAARYRQEARGVRVTFVENPGRAAGLSSSVRRALHKARYSSAALLLPVDLGELQARDIDRLIRRWRAARRCVIARHIAMPGAPPRAGIPVILPRWLYVRALTISGDLGLRDLINGLPSTERQLIDLPSAALDVDTPGDLRSVRAKYRRQSLAF